MTDAPRIAVLDYGSGNIHSAVKALQAAGAEVQLSADSETVLQADGLVVPGVGSFGTVMHALRARRGDELIGRRLAGGRAVLGICVGMQILFEHGTESAESSATEQATEGMGEWPGTVQRLQAPILPHMGWSTVEAAEGSRLFRGIEQERFYFVHSYAATQWTLDVIPPFPEPAVTWATHGEKFVAAVENGPLTAVQFHPEKSGAAGIALLRNWIDSLARSKQ